MKQYLGALLLDLPFYLSKLLPNFNKNTRYSWIGIRNRKERLIPSENHKGVKCNWQWTTDLYLPKVFPVFGRWIFRRAFRDFPIILKEQPDFQESDKLDMSFIIGHRGMDRLPILLTTLKSIAGQRGCDIECIVVEQDNVEQIRKHLPNWVRYIHTPLPEKDAAYSRSWAFNVGAEAAKSNFLFFHDNDMLIPEVYARDLLYYHKKGFDFINLKRFIFYLDRVSSEKLAVTGDLCRTPVIEVIVQNLEAGGSFGADRQAYFEIGGFDERFIGWGGEDNEFWERANTRKVYSYGYLPIVHLWHASQSGKNQSDANGILLYQQLTEQSAENRIQKLRAVQ